MTDSDSTREASATIRGYIYQFDATIRKILACNVGDSCTVEGVEDFDIHSSDFSSYFQCKYYAWKKLTASILRDIILPMLMNFIGLNRIEKTKNRYYLYGYFNETSYEHKSISLSELKSVLVRREKVKDESGQTSYKIVNLQDVFGITDEDINGFVNQFRLELGATYEDNKQSVVRELVAIFRVSTLEAEKCIYPSALSLVSTLACNASGHERTITKEQFIGEIRPNRTLYSLWHLREKSRQSYCREMKSKFFSFKNIDPEERFFIIEFPEGTLETVIVHIINAIRSKWSSHAVRRKQDKDRYAPYIYLNNSPTERINSIKRALHHEGCVFVDGYPFQGAEFSLQSISQMQTYQNKISLRFVNSEEDLFRCLSGLERHKSIYQFFIDKPLDIDLDIYQISIPIKDVDMITDIV